MIINYKLHTTLFSADAAILTTNELQGGSNQNTPPDKMQFLDNREIFTPTFLGLYGSCYNSEFKKNILVFSRVMAV